MKMIMVFKKYFFRISKANTREFLENIEDMILCYHRKGYTWMNDHWIIYKECIFAIYEECYALSQVKLFKYYYIRPLEGGGVWQFL